MIDQFVLDNVFYRVGEAYWRDCPGEGEGYIVYWPKTNDHFHTYRYPPNWLT